MRYQPIKPIYIAAAALLMAGACNRTPSVPDTQSTAGVQPRNQPVTITGCLSSGVAEDTFVLTADPSGDSAKPATYQLTGSKITDLRQYAGQRVNVSGTVRSEQEVVSNGGTVQEKPAKGTQGTPTVETKTDLDVRRLEVSDVQSTGHACAKK
jgi:hypothetical protein